LKSSSKFIAPARSMTFGELKAFRAAGLDPAFGEGKESGLGVIKMKAEGGEWIAEKIYGLTDEGVAYSEIMKLAEDTYRLTYSGDEKN